MLLLPGLFSILVWPFTHPGYTQEPNSADPTPGSDLLNQHPRVMAETCGLFIRFPQTAPAFSVCAGKQAILIDIL